MEILGVLFLLGLLAILFAGLKVAFSIAVFLLKIFLVLFAVLVAVVVAPLLLVTVAPLGGILLILLGLICLARR
jgi:hypothetical protein